MNEATSALDPPGGYQLDIQRLISRGRTKGTLTMEEIVLVLPSAALRADLAEADRRRGEARGVGPAPMRPEEPGLVRKALVLRTIEALKPPRQRP